VVDRLSEAFEPDSEQGEPAMLPVLDKFNPYATTALTDYSTTRDILPVNKSHLNAVVLDSGWEGKAAQVLDASEAVECYVKNDRLGLAIPYCQGDTEHMYEPDFVVKLSGSGLRVLVEVKGHQHFNKDMNAAKYAAARKWVRAVNRLNDPTFGQWNFTVVADEGMNDLKEALQRMTNDRQEEVPEVIMGTNFDDQATK